MGKKYYIEGYGCSLNMGETEQISGFLQNHGFSKIKNMSLADYIIINTCSVKMVTEQRMLSRIKSILEKKKKKAKILVVGCLGATNPNEIKAIDKDLIVLDTKLESLCKVLGLEEHSFSPRIIADKFHKEISIIPISVGCVSNCTYCATKIARNKLVSYSIDEINSAFKRALRSSKEIHITSQDLGCYGFDKKTDLSDLIKELLKNEGDYRIRLGMMSPEHFHKIRNKLMPLFDDERLYKFLHLPVQSGSNKVLKNMQRKYSVEEFIKEVEFARKKVPDISISTDIIVGFPGETKSDFEKTLKLIKEIRPDVVNISRFGKRKGTKAAIMKDQLQEFEKKQRSRELSFFCKELLLKKNKNLFGKKLKVLVSEKASGGYFTARTNNYKPILVNSGFGDFVNVEVKEVFSNFSKGSVISV